MSVKSSDYHLWDSFILNSEFNCHVCNNHSRIYDFQLATQDEILYVENFILNIQDYDSVEIILQDSDDLFSIALCQVAFISTFHINIITVNQFMKKKIHFESQNNRLKHNSDIFCKIPHWYDQWVLKYNNSSLLLDQDLGDDETLCNESENENKNTVFATSID